MSLPPADSPAPAPERPIPWWRHRRRLFYLAVVIVPVATLWGAWVWWYRADFPVPRDYQCVAIGMDEHAYSRWVYNPQGILFYWKRDREIRRLHLPATAWQNEESGVTFTFGADGQLSVASDSGWEDRVAEKSLYMVAALTEGEKAALPSLHQTRYHFDPTVPVRNLAENQQNLSLPDSKWEGLVWAKSSREIILVLKFKPKGADFPSLIFHLTRVPAAP